jgi:HK97 family phage major capsid protein
MVKNINDILRNHIRQHGVFKFVDIGEGKGKLNDSVLPVEKENDFVQAMQKATVLLDASRYIALKSAKHDIDRVDYEIELESGSRNQSTGEIKLTDQDPDFKLNELSVEKFMAKMRITTEAIEDNFKQKTLVSMLTDMFGRSAGRSFERICIYGNTQLPAIPEIPTGYRQINGWIQKKDHDKISYTDEKITDILRIMYDTLDPSYLDQAKFYVPTSRVSEYRRALQKRQTSLGDTSITSKGELLFEGIPVVPVPALDYPLRNPVFRDKISDETMFLGRPTNFVHGLLRQITIKSAEDIESDLVKFVLSLRGDCHFEDETKTIMAQHTKTKPEPPKK